MDPLQNLGEIMSALLSGLVAIIAAIVIFELVYRFVRIARGYDRVDPTTDTRADAYAAAYEHVVDPVE